MWLHRKPTTGSGKNQKYLDFAEFKKSVKAGSTRKQKVQTPTAAQEKERLEFAGKFIKTRKEADDGGRS